MKKPMTEADRNEIVKAARVLLSAVEANSKALSDDQLEKVFAALAVTFKALQKRKVRR